MSQGKEAENVERMEEERVPENKQVIGFILYLILLTWLQLNSFFSILHYSWCMASLLWVSAHSRAGV